MNASFITLSPWSGYRIGMIMLRTVLATLLCWVALSAPGFAAGGRVALVIGNATYASATTLANPLNDAADLSAALEAAGFAVTRANDLSAVAMRAQLKAFRDKARSSEIAMIFYAGHGLEIDSQNYLVPVDAALETDSDVLYDAIPLDLLTEAVSGARTLSMVILDACRNNPFAARLKGSTRAIGRGLSPIEPQGGTLVAFAARAGTIANDGSGRNSPFTKALLRYIGEPGLDVSLLFRKVRDEVMADTLNQQEPFVYGSLPGRAIYLVPPVDVASTEASPTPQPSPGVTTEQEEFAWSLVKDTTDVTRLTEFIDAFPRGAHIEEAIARLKTLSGPAEAGVQLDPAPTTEASLTVPAPETLPQGTQVRETTTVATTTTALPVVEMDERELATLLQTELNRIGCQAGTPDGIWGKQSQTSLARFATQTRREASTLALSPALLNLLKSQPAQTCPVVCSVREDLVDGQCVLKTCPSGQRLNSKGICYVPVAAQPTKKKPPVADEDDEPRVKVEIEVPQSLCSLCGP